jgi:hypothetical protein
MCAELCVICYVYVDTVQEKVVVVFLLVVLYFLSNVSFRENFLENGHSRWPKHVAGYAVYNAINLHICMCTDWVWFVVTTWQSWQRNWKMSARYCRSEASHLKFGSFVSKTTITVGFRLIALVELHVSISAETVLSELPLMQVERWKSRQQIRLIDWLTDKIIRIQKVLY